MVSKQHDAVPFHFPVLTSLPDRPDFIADYSQVVTQPMDICTIEQKLAGEKYETYANFVTDVHLMFRNCERYRARGKFFKEDYVRLAQIARMLWCIFDVKEEAYRSRGDLPELEGSSRKKKLIRYFNLDKFEVLLEGPVR